MANDLGAQREQLGVWYVPGPSELEGLRDDEEIACY